MTRSEDLFAGVTQFNDYHNRWADPKANSPENPTLEYWDRLATMVRMFESGDLTSDCRKLAMSVFELGTQYLAHDQTDNIDPPESFWSARQELEKALTEFGAPGMKPYRETVKQLKEQEVTLDQIGRMVGLRNPDGTGNQRLVQQELDSPGSVIGPDFVHPDDVEEDAATELARQLYVSRRSAFTKEKENNPTESPVCPETSLELWSLNGMTVKQAAKMLKRPESDVAAEWDQFEKDAADPGGTSSPFTPLTAEPLPETTELPVTAPLSSSGADGADDDGDEFSEWTYAQVKDHAKECGVEFTKKPSKAWLCEQIRAHETSDTPQELPQEASVNA